jgi:hypothetical protein
VGVERRLTYETPTLASRRAGIHGEGKNRACRMCHAPDEFVTRVSKIRQHARCRPGAAMGGNDDMRTSRLRKDALGYGLAICQALVESHHGTITAVRDATGNSDRPIRD